MVINIIIKGSLVHHIPQTRNKLMVKQLEKELEK